MGRQEFRPDKPGVSLWSKLYPTRKQRLAVLKWLMFSLVLVALSVIQDVIFSRGRLMGGTTDLVPCLVFLVCLTEGAENGAVFSLLAALFYQFSGSGPGAYCVVLIPAIAIAGAAFRQNYFQPKFRTALMCLLPEMLVYEGVVFAAGLFLGQARPDRWFVFPLTAVYSMGLAPIAYPVSMAIGKIGGETWKD